MSLVDLGIWFCILFALYSLFEAGKRARRGATPGEAMQDALDEHNARRW